MAWTASSDGRDSLARIRYLNTGAELDAVERATTTSPDPIDARNPIHPTPPAWTAAIVLTVQEAASVVKLTQRAIYGAIQRGDLVAYKPGGRLRINEKDLDAWLEATRVTPAASSPPPARMIPPPDLVTPSRRETSDGTLRARVRAQRRKRSAA